VPKGLQVTDEEYERWQQEIGKVALPDNVFELVFLLRQQLENLPQAPYVSDRRWKKAIRLLQASAFFSGREAVAPIDIILLKDCLWHDASAMTLMQQQIEALMTGHAWQQHAMLTKLGAIEQRRLQLQQQQSDQQALTVIKQGSMFSRRPHYQLPEGVQGETLTLLLQKPLRLHDMDVIHITLAREALDAWLQKGGEIRGKLNGIGFAQPLNLEVDNRQHLIIRDVSLQGTALALPGAQEQSVPEEVKQQLDALDNEWHQQHNRFSEQQKCLFIHSDWLGRIEASLQDVGAQIKQARQC